MQPSQDQPSMPPSSPPMAGGRRNPKTVRIVVVLIAIILAISGAVVFYVLTQSSACNFSSTDPLIFDQPERPDTLDPHVTFSTPGWGIVQQIYQTLVNYNGSSYTTYVPVLAKSWSVSADNLNYTFVLRQDVHFSNGDPFNAYVMWFSLYRAIVMNQAGSFILQENFWLPGVTYYSGANESANATAWVTNALNSWDFFNPTTEQKALMAADNNSFQAVDAYTLVLHGGNGYLDAFPYAFLLASISGPIASAVDPKVIQQNGQVHYTQENTWMTTHMVGTGPYVLTGGFLDPTASSYTLKPDPNYWAINASKAEPLNNIIQPAHASIQVDFQNDAAIAVNDMKTGKVMSASFAYIGPSTVQSLQGVPCVAANALDTVYGSTAGGWWIYMNQNTDPFTNWSVRQAVVHAINYQRIIDVAFGGHAERWVGPVPPGYPYYNPDNLAPYQYDVTLAKKFMSQSPWPNGYPTQINYEYVNLGDWADVARLLQDDLKQIGINILPTKIDNIDKLYELQKRNLDGNCIAQNATGGGPFPIGQEFYTSDYISPDDWTQNNAISYGSANDCMAAYNDPAMDTLVLDAATQTDASTARTEYANMTRLMYDNATVAWLVVPTQFQVVNTHLQGFVSNPMGAAIPFVVTQNTAVARRG
ncbi:MAG: ABC transporter substrate-binding protein [Methanobacteriota archaeon]|nr:MAG: ABC transporter substrate-binding protein [Euryarchaeota archaeon]